MRTVHDAAEVAMPSSLPLTAAHGGGLLAAGFAPARGFPPGQVIPATIVAVLLTAAVVLGAVRYRQGRFALLDRVATAAGDRSGLPGWAALPTALTSLSLVVAVFGFYWDVAWHIDKGRDNGPFSTPAHYPIIIGLLGIAIAGVLAVVLDRDDHPGGVRLREGWRVSVGGALLLLCGLVALAGFPLDDIWHTLFGQDVTLWGPTHIQMIGGASLATLATWILQEEGARRHPQLRAAAAARRGLMGLLVRHSNVIAAGAFLVGLSTLQGEFDYGVPQFRAVYQPILIMLAAGIGLVAARIRAGRGGALGAVLVFLTIRGLLTLLIGPVLGRSILHFPLYLAEAVLVEVAARFLDTRRQVTFGAGCGVLIGTIGLAAEWGWSQAWMPLPWTSALWPLGAVLGFVTAVGAGVLGGLAGRALLPEQAPRQATPRLVVPLAWAAVFATIAIALPMSAHTGYRATVTLTDTSPAPQRTVLATVRLSPPQAANQATWFNLTSWQGGTGTYNGQITGQWVVPLHQVSPGVWRSTTPVPVYGKWKTLLRLGTVGSLQAVPVYLPADPAIPAKAVPATSSFTRSFVPDKKILQREAVGGSVNLQRAAYAALGLIGLIWIAAVSFGLRRLDRVRPRTRRDGGRPYAPVTFTRSASASSR
ncbi:MAG TPA: hypothetical protein VFT62_11200 [Mycobacteriales bacterium]|nr:hypothetical protein [Mycobacteriales bacterium]